MKKLVTIDQGKTVYNMKFFGLKDLYDYLKSNPEVNTRIFSTQNSIVGKNDFAGKPLDDAIEYLLSGYQDGLDDFLKANKRLQNTIPTEYLEEYEVKRSIFAGAPIAPLVAANVPDCRVMIEPVYETEVRNVYYNLMYSYQATKEQVRNRGLGTIYMIQALEARGVMVNFTVFGLLKHENEILHISIDLKKPGEELLNISKCYYPMIAIEFLRRILFRVIETSDVSDPAWGKDYGITLTLQECREFYKAKAHDIIISRISELGIEGVNIYEDIYKMIKTLNLSDEFNVQDLKRLSRK